MTNSRTQTTGMPKPRPPADLDAGANSDKSTSVHPDCDLARGCVSATVTITARPERVFRALTSDEVCKWWVRPGVFDTRQWAGVVSVGGRWQAAGMGNGRPYGLEGEFLEIDPPRKLVHTWQPAGTSGTPTVATFFLEAFDGGTRLTLQHSGFVAQAACTNTSIGWETSFVRLAEMLAEERTSGS